MLRLITFFILTNSYSSTFYPGSYEDAKGNFLKISRKILLIKPHAKLEKISVGANKLTTDYLYIPAKKPKKLIVITSGTHGPEGYAGSALQSYFLKNTLPKLDFKNIGVLVIHALNPWGFKYNRRGTKNNVNLNRNFYVDESIFSTKNKGYMLLREDLEIASEINSTFNFPAFPLLMKMLFEKGVSLESLTEAIGKGQYISSKGINYGGKKFESQTKSIINLFKQITPEYKSIFHIDIHTGLGDDGVLHIMPKSNINKRSKLKFEKMFLSSDDKDLYSVTKESSKGFYKIIGDHAEIISLLNPSDDKTVIGITAEFGTLGGGLVGKVKTINRLIRENRGHFYGYGNLDAKKEIQRDYLELFNPSSREWRSKVMKKGEFLLNQVILRFIKDQEIK